MVANCGDCGATVDADSPGLLARGDSHLHFSGACGSCGRRVQWHQTVIGGGGEIPLLGKPRTCPVRCRHHDPAASKPAPN